jgi:hypothetical protein
VSRTENTSTTRRLTETAPVSGTTRMHLAELTVEISKECSVIVCQIDTLSSGRGAGRAKLDARIGTTFWCHKLGIIRYMGPSILRDE